MHDGADPGRETEAFAWQSYPMRMGAFGTPGHLRDLAYQNTTRLALAGLAPRHVPWSARARVAYSSAARYVPGVDS